MALIRRSGHAASVVVTSADPLSTSCGEIWPNRKWCHQIRVARPRFGRTVQEFGDLWSGALDHPLRALFATAADRPQLGPVQELLDRSVIRKERRVGLKSRELATHQTSNGQRCKIDLILHGPLWTAREKYKSGAHEQGAHAIVERAHRRVLRSQS